MFPDYPEDSLIDQSCDVVTSRKDVIIPQMTCMGKVIFSEDIFHSASYVCSREFDSILTNHDPSYSLHVNETVMLFDKCFVFEEAFLNDSDLLFTLAKISFERIEFAAKGNQAHSVTNYSSDLRNSLINFMSYLKVFTHRYLSDFGKEEELELVYEKLAEFIRNTTLWLGSVSDIPSIVFSNGSLVNNNSSTAVLFHTYFDIKWSLIEITYMAANLRKYNESCRKLRESFTEILQNLKKSLCDDLLFMAVRRFLELSPNQWPGSTPFTCTCIRELWFMLLVYLKSESSIFNFILQQFTKLLETPTPGSLLNFSDIKRINMPSKDSLALVWLFTHLSRLSGFSQTGVWDKNFSRMESNYDVINKLIQLYFNGTDSMVNEDRTRGLMGCLNSLSHIWGSNLNTCIILWEYFNKKIGENFTQTSAFEIVPYSSSLTWYENLTASIEPWKSLTARHNSFFVFLRLLGYHMESMNTRNQSSLKARLFVKLQGKKLQELSLIGLYHMLSACLTIVLTSESPDDMCAKILEMSSTHKQKSIFFVAEMVMLLICVVRGRDCQEVATSISAQLEKISRGLKDGELKVRDEQRKHGAVFVENFQEVIFQSKNFSHGQLRLIDKPLRGYLKNCGSCDRSVILSALSSMMKKIRSGSTANSEEFYAAVMTHVYPLMKEKFSSIEHVSFFVELTNISLETSRTEFPSIFTFLCLDEKVGPRLSLKYLSHLFETRQFLVNLSLSLDNYQAILIQGWFRISFLLPATEEMTDDFDRLNSIVKRLPRIAELVVQSKLQTNSSEMILDFLLMMSANHQSIQNLSERATVRETYLQYIGPLDKYLSGSFVGTFWEDADQLCHVLRLGGQLYFHCGNIIYTKGKIDCLLAQLNNVLLVPVQFSDVNKELPPTIISPFQQYLPIYIFGLFRLNPSRDPYVMRCLSTIFQTYMTRFPPNHAHPFTRCWIGLENDPVSSLLVPIVRTWFLQTISSSVLPQKVAKTSPYLQPTLHWLKFLITNKDWKLEILRLILLPILELSLMLDEIVGKKSVTDFLQASVCAPDPEQTTVVEQALSDFVGRHLAFNSNRLFKLIEVISFLNSDLVRRVLPKIREQVAITESKRGTGIDSILRQHLATLELSLAGS